MNMKAQSINIHWMIVENLLGSSNFSESCTKTFFPECVAVYTIFGTIFVDVEVWLLYVAVRLAIHRLALLSLQM